MKLKTLWVAMLIAAGSIGVAYATPTITNGNFDTTSPAHTNPTQFGGTAGSTCGISGRTWGGQFVSGWSGSGYSIWYPSAAAAAHKPAPSTATQATSICLLWSQPRRTDR